MTEWPRKVGAVALRELGGYFLSPAAYVVIFVFLLLNGTAFYVFAKSLGPDPRGISLIVESLFNFALIWVLPLSPILTMRLLSEEKRTGTIELLMTAPVSEAQVVAGKYLAAQGFYTLIWLSLLPLLVFLEILGSLDWGLVHSTYVGLFSLGLLTNAIGLWASSVTRNQLISAMLALSANLALFCLYLVEAALSQSTETERFFRYLSFAKHFWNEFTRGIVDVRFILLYGSFAALILFFTVRALEKGKAR